MKTKKNKNT